MATKVMITGANIGLGKETARQLAMLNTTQKIYLACRNEEKALAAVADLETQTGRRIFQIILLDTSNLASVEKAISQLPEPIDGLIMNAGGMGGKAFAELDATGATRQFSVNVLGHVALVEGLLKARKLSGAVLYAGSEAARGVSKMGIKRPNIEAATVAEFKSIVDGTYFGKNKDPMVYYAYSKLLAALYMSALARRHPELRIVTVSPGSTSGTEVMQDMPWPMKFMFNAMLKLHLLQIMGMVHSLHEGANRYVRVLQDEVFKSGVFYGSKKSVLTGQLVEQATIWEKLADKTAQENAYAAIASFL
jgi:NAD(P)-dependent dehydrogenase (short-subunit alcohol dehydrogenase family)